LECLRVCVSVYTVNTADDRIRVLVVDDHPGMREGISAIINSQPDMVVIGEACDGAEAVRSFKETLPGVTLMDFNLPVICGLKALASIRAEFPQARVIVISAVLNDDQIQRALEAGAQAYLHKDMLRVELLPAVRAVHRGETYIPNAIAERLKATARKQKGNK